MGYFCSLVFGLFLFSSFTDLPVVDKSEDIERLLVFEEKNIESQTASAAEVFKKGMDALFGEERGEISFTDTIERWDKLSGTLQALMGFYEGLNLIHPNIAVREKCGKAISSLSAVFLEGYSAHPQLYGILKKMEQEETLLPQQSYYLSQRIEELERLGANLSKEKQEEVSALEQEIGDLCLLFQRNIQEDRKVLVVSEEELPGLQPDFLASLPRNAKGEYILSCDYPVYLPIMGYCSSASTRKRLFELFVNRAYPANEAVLEAIIAKRAQLAEVLGFGNFAEYDIQSQMAKSPAVVLEFLDTLSQRALPKQQEEFQELIKDLPQGVSLTSEGQIESSDAGYLSNCYKAKKFSLDEREITEYFPLENVLDKLISIYSSFFNLSIEKVSHGPLWDPEVRVISIKKEGRVLGHLLLDLFSREGKYGHACECTLIPSYQNNPGLSLVVTNFPSKPALLSLGQVRTLFHEFGHAMHDILGASSLIRSSGTRVKTDFVELPSQLLEEWVSDPIIMRQISSHYQTGKPIPQEKIDEVLRAKNFDVGHAVQRQCFLAKLSLVCFQSGKVADLAAITKDMRKQMLSNYRYIEEDRFYLSFGHLTGYATKYYGYLWAKVFALDVFSKIKEQGLLNPDIGSLYVEKILSKGGSEDPENLLRDFLGREASLEGFIQDLGL